MFACFPGPVLCQDSSFEHVSDHAIMSIENKVIYRRIVIYHRLFYHEYDPFESS